VYFGQKPRFNKKQLIYVDYVLRMATMIQNRMWSDVVGRTRTTPGGEGTTARTSRSRFAIARRREMFDM
jgi:hypothetical protein